MRQIGWSVVLMLIVFGIGIYGQKQEKERKPTAAVLDFKIISGLTPQEAAALTSKFRNSFSNTGKYTVLERGEMDKILKEQDFKMSDVCNSSECAVEIGQLLAAEKMVTGDIGKIGETYSVTIKLLDVTTGKVDVTINEEYRGKPDGLLTVFDVMAQKITGTYRVSKTKWYILGGVVVAGGAAAAVLLSGGKSGTTASGFPNPPSPPKQ
ncbi:MAG TPA: CsgG/HfaB family protein [bacterium]|nr:CsgG/HfaB family protein [bacterium]HMW35891.1 CsgG/HfaB family protein [bacterium]HMZ05720.1 CsgG/HfaB family protein [bacterium]HNB09901.1 CsgG/HfaB family protein [bacterium]HNB56258.1 CsgG/HfaB family protein [bacterium]